MSVAESPLARCSDVPIWFGFESIQESGDSNANSESMTVKIARETRTSRYLVAIIVRCVFPIVRCVLGGKRLRDDGNRGECERVSVR